MKQLDHFLQSTNDKEYYQRFIQFKFSGEKYKFLLEDEILYVFLHTATQDNKFVRCKLVRIENVEGEIKEIIKGETDRYLDYGYSSIMKWLFDNFPK